MTVYTHLDAAIRAAQKDADTKGEPHAVIEWWHGARQYHIRTLTKAESLCKRHADATVKVRIYPERDALFGGAES